MPILFEIDPRRSYFVSVYDGPVTDEELYDSYRALCEGGEWRPTMNELVDTSSAEMSQITGGGLRRLEEYLSGLYADSGIKSVRTAVYAPKKLPFALARIYEWMSEESKVEVRVFRDLAAAQRWLDGHQAADEIRIDSEHVKSTPHSNIGVLSRREIEVLTLIAAGSSNDEIAEILSISPHTAKNHASNIYEKLEVSSRTKAVAKATDLGLISHGL